MSAFGHAGFGSANRRNQLRAQGQIGADTYGQGVRNAMQAPTLNIYNAPQTYQQSTGQGNAQQSSAQPQASQSLPPMAASQSQSQSQPTMSAYAQQPEAAEPQPGITSAVNATDGRNPSELAFYSAYGRNRSDEMESWRRAINQPKDDAEKELWRQEDLILNTKKYPVFEMPTGQGSMAWVATSNGKTLVLPTNEWGTALNPQTGKPVSKEEARKLAAQIGQDRSVANIDSQLASAAQFSVQIKNLMGQADEEARANPFGNNPYRSFGLSPTGEFWKRVSVGQDGMPVWGSPATQTPDAATSPASAQAGWTTYSPPNSPGRAQPIPPQSTGTPYRAEEDPWERAEREQREMMDPNNPNYWMNDPVYQQQQRMFQNEWGIDPMTGQPLANRTPQQERDHQRAMGLISDPEPGPQYNPVMQSQPSMSPQDQRMAAIQQRAQDAVSRSQHYANMGLSPERVQQNLAARGIDETYWSRISNDLGYDPRDGMSPESWVGDASQVIANANRARTDPIGYYRELQAQGLM